MDKRIVLLVADQPTVRQSIKACLAGDAYSLFEAESCDGAEKILKQVLPDLFVIDWLAAQVSEGTFLRFLHIHEAFSQVPLLVLTKAPEDSGRIPGLEAGADDYLMKPFLAEEFMLRVKALLNQGTLHATEDHLCFGPLSIHPVRHQAAVNDKTMTLRPIEYRLLRLFMQYPDRIFTREQLMYEVWGKNRCIDERTVDVAIKRLREQLRGVACDKWIKTVRGMGYRLDSRCLLPFT